MSGPTLKTAILPGWYGKIPNLGDFASRRLPDGFIRRWDRWLQDGMAQVRNDLGERWREVYLVAPILRFWVAPGTLDKQGWTGLVMPSVDRVGRYFPLTFAQPLDSLAAALAARKWLAALDLAARRVLDSDFTVDDLEAELQALPALDEHGPNAIEAQSTQSRAARLLAGVSAQSAWSVWWHNDADDDSAFMVFAGLPPPTAFKSMVER